jgi:hypothetical protein
MLKLLCRNNLYGNINRAHTTTKIGSTLGCKISEKNLTKKWVEGGLSRGFNS